jgi:hypothetical protein
MDEIDAIGGRRFSEGTSADREIQRTLMEVCHVIVLPLVKMLCWSSVIDCLIFHWKALAAFILNVLHWVVLHFLAVRCSFSIKWMALTFWGK